MNICFVCGEYPPGAHGGIGTMVQMISRALVSAGHRARVVGVYSDLAAPVAEDDQGVEVWRLPVATGRFGWINSRRALFARVAEWVRLGEIDLIELPDWQGWGAHWPRLNVPVVTRLNGSSTYFAAEMGGQARWLTRHLEGRSLRRSDFWCSVSRYTARRTRELFDLRSGPDAVLANPVESRPTTAWERRVDGPVVFSGTLTEKKGVVQLIDAWNVVSPKFPRTILHMLGKDGGAPGGGSMTVYLQRRLSPAAGPTVRFHGHMVRAQLLDMLTEARVAVLPSFAEAFAIAPLEAMAAGCPTIGSALGSGPELIENGVDGLTVNPKRPGEIESALSTLLADDELARRMAECGRNRINRHFAVGQLLPLNLNFYRDCVTAFVKKERRLDEQSRGRLLATVARQS